MSGTEHNSASTRDGPDAEPRRGPWATRWQGHPAVRAEEQLTSGERAADHLRNGMGPFILLNLLLLNEPMLLHLHEDASPPVIGDSAEPDGLVHDFDVVDLQSLVRLGRPKGIQP